MSVYWNVVQACVWIATRNDSVVAYVQTDARSENSAQSITRTSLFEAYVDVRKHVDLPFYSPREAATLIAETCAADRLSMLGRANGKGDLIEIPATSWAHLVLRDDQKLGVIAAPPDISDHTATWWDHLAVRVDATKGLWGIPVWWSPSQAVIWIVSRDESVVSRIPVTEYLDRLPPLPICRTTLEPPISQREAPEHLLNKWVEGALNIFGRAGGHGARTIAARPPYRPQKIGFSVINDSLSLWMKPTLVELVNNLPPGKSAWRPESTWWSHLWVLAEQCKSCWPSPNSVVSAPRKPTQAPPPGPTVRGVAMFSFSPSASRPFEADVGGGTPESRHEDPRNGGSDDDCDGATEGALRSVSALLDEDVIAWTAAEILRRKANDEEVTRDPMVLAMCDHFDGLGTRAARALYQRVQPEIRRSKMGRPLGKSGQK